MSFGALGSQPGPQPTVALQQGFAVVELEHRPHQQGDTLGIDFQARLDYGYQAVAKLTPMAEALIAAAYGKGPDRSLELLQRRAPPWSR